MIGDVFPGEWAKDGECRWSDPDLFFPEIMTRQVEAAAKAVCNVHCPVQVECLEFALEMESELSVRYRAGIWGGLTPEERAAVDRARSRSKRAG